jgi:hypothetical protein
MARLFVNAGPWHLTFLAAFLILGQNEYMSTRLSEVVCCGQAFSNTFEYHVVDGDEAEYRFCRQLTSYPLVIPIHPSLQPPGTSRFANPPDTQERERMACLACRRWTSLLNKYANPVTNVITATLPLVMRSR